MTSKNTYSLENPEGNPWTFLSKTQIYDNRFITHSQHQLLNVVGNPAEYTFVHFKNRAVSIVPYEDGHVYLVGQFRYVVGAYSWELPAGGCPPENEVLEAAKWELKEETGLRAESYEPFIEMHTSNAITDEWAIVFLATGLTQGEAAPEENEVLQVRKLSLDDLFAEVEAGDITDAMTVAAAYKLMLLRAKKQLPLAGSDSA